MPGVVASRQKRLHPVEELPGPLYAAASVQAGGASALAHVHLTLTPLEACTGQERKMNSRKDIHSI